MGEDQGWSRIQITNLRKRPVIRGALRPQPSHSMHMTLRIPRVRLLQDLKRLAMWEWAYEILRNSYGAVNVSLAGSKHRLL